MLFDFDLIIPANTLQSAKVESIIKLTKGTLSEIRVNFPPGCAGMVYVSVFDKLRQIMPANEGASLNFDDRLIISQMDYPLIDVPFQITLAGWSPGTTYQHIITFQFELQPILGQSWDDFNKSLLELQNAG